MNVKEFMRRYDASGKMAISVEAASRVFWDRLSDAQEDDAKAMARDFLLACPGVECSSTTSARELLKLPAPMNPVQAYVDSGKRAAKAMNDNDGSRYDFESRWFRSAKALETGVNREIAQAAYDEGYAFARVVPRVERFA